MKQPSALRFPFLIGCLVLLTVLYTLAIKAYYVGFFNDDAFFIIGARSLVHGGFLELNRPGHPLLLSYMPGTSILLLPVALFSPETTIPYQIWFLLLSVFTMGVAFILLRSFLDSFWLAGALILTALNPMMISLSGTVLSDVPYLMVTLLFFTGFRRWEKEMSLSRALWLGAAGVFAFYIRPMGALLNVALVLFLLKEKRLKLAASVMVLMAAMMGPYFLRNYLARGYWFSYGAQFVSAYRLPFSWRDHAAWFFTSQGSYLTELFSRLFFRWPFSSFGSLWGRLVTVLGTGVVWVGFFKGEKTGVSLAMKTYVVAYFLVIGFWRVYASRYLLPVIPFAALFFFQGLRWLAGRFSNPKRVGQLAVALALLLAISPAETILSASLADQNDLNTPTESTFDWVKSHTAQDDVFAAGLEARFYLWTGRPCLAFPFYRDASTVDNWVRANHVSYILVDDEPFTLETREDQKLKEGGVPRWQLPPRWILVFKNHEEGTLVFKRP